MVTLFEQLLYHQLLLYLLLFCINLNIVLLPGKFDHNITSKKRHQPKMIPQKSSNELKPDIDHESDTPKSKDDYCKPTSLPLKHKVSNKLIDSIKLLDKNLVFPTQSEQSSQYMSQIKEKEKTKPKAEKLSRLNLFL